MIVSRYCAKSSILFFRLRRALTRLIPSHFFHALSRTFVSCIKYAFDTKLTIHGSNALFLSTMLANADPSSRSSSQVASESLSDEQHNTDTLDFSAWCSLSYPSPTAHPGTWKNSRTYQRWRSRAFACLRKCSERSPSLWNMSTKCLPTRFLLALPRRN